MRYVYLLATMLYLTGCGIVYSDVKQAYVDAKVVYQDAKFVVYEIEEEVKSLKDGTDKNESRP